MSILGNFSKVAHNSKIRLKGQTEYAYTSSVSNFWDVGSSTAWDVSLLANNNNRLFIAEDSSSITHIRFKKKCLYFVSYNFEQSNAAFFYMYQRSSDFTTKLSTRNTQVNASYDQRQDLIGLAEVGDNVYYSGGIAPAASYVGSIQLLAIEVV